MKIPAFSFPFALTLTASGSGVAAANLRLSLRNGGTAGANGGVIFGPMINDQVLQNEPTRPYFTKTVFSEGGVQTLITQTIRPPGTRSPIHNHDFGGITCVVSGEMTLKLQGSAGRDLTARSGECYFMPANLAMSGMNTGESHTVMMDMFTVPEGQEDDATTLWELGFGDSDRDPLIHYPPEGVVAANVPELLKPKAAPEKCWENCTLNGLYGWVHKYPASEPKLRTDALLNPSSDGYSSRNLVVPGLCGRVAEGGGTCASGINLTTFRETRAGGTRSPVSVDPHGGTHCVLWGATTFVVDGKEDEVLRAGECARVPAGKRYSAVNTQEGESTVMAYHAVPHGADRTVAVEL